MPAGRLEFMVTDSTMTVLITAGKVAAGFEISEDVRVVALDVDLHIDAMDASSADLSHYRMICSSTSGARGCPSALPCRTAPWRTSCAAWNGSGLPGGCSCGDDDQSRSISPHAGLYSAVDGGRANRAGGIQDGYGRGLLAGPARAAEATVLQATPVIWPLLAATGWRTVARKPEQPVANNYAIQPGNLVLDCTTELWNLYGPTETTIWSTLGRVERGVEAISIGRPIANTRYISTKT